MKNQYFGDINDYRKYGLLRCIISASQLRTLIAWMLTPDDSSNDGNFLSYLKEPTKWEKYDPELYRGLSFLLSSYDNRSVNLLEFTDILPNAEYFSHTVPDTKSERQTWFEALSKYAENADLILLDPDNGLEVKSVPYGSKRSGKYLYWREVGKLWELGSSLLIYQHFVREKRPAFIERMLHALEEAAPSAFVEAFSTPHVVFLLALQPHHARHHEEIVRLTQSRWGDQIRHWSLTLSN